jgi:hypothetical protein
MRASTIAFITGAAGAHASQCKTTAGVVVGTGTIKEVFSIASADACCAACFDFGYACKGFTYDSSGTERCYLKDNTAGSVPTANRTSGAPGSGPRPPTPAENRTVNTRACLPPHDGYAFCNASLSLDARLDDLISRLKVRDLESVTRARIHSRTCSPTHSHHALYKR